MWIDALVLFTLVLLPGLTLGLCAWLGPITRR